MNNTHDRPYDDILLSLSKITKPFSIKNILSVFSDISMASSCEKIDQIDIQHEMCTIYRIDTGEPNFNKFGSLPPMFLAYRPTAIVIVGEKRFYVLIALGDVHLITDHIQNQNIYRLRISDQDYFNISPGRFQDNSTGVFVSGDSDEFNMKYLIASNDRWLFDEDWLFNHMRSLLNKPKVENKTSEQLNRRAPKSGSNNSKKEVDFNEGKSKIDSNFNERRKSNKLLYWLSALVIIGVIIYQNRDLIYSYLKPPISKEEKNPVPSEIPVSPEKKSDSINTVVIGTQSWSSNNLNVKVFRNGDSINEAHNKQEWDQFCKERKPAYCHADNDPGNDEKHGLLYNWYAAIDERNICPEGYRIPGKKDLDYLISNFAFSDLSSELITVFPGWKGEDGYYRDFDTTSTFWSNEEKYPGCQYTLTVSKKVKGGQVKIGEQKPNDGYSIRCIKD